ncbi:hypothetical protein J31TS4_46930 [Paenibacillus sp. J31TS4]|nr:hypothetical protein J31TS4_46930 [Paenibacillus sp. J31TS4]
MRVAGNRADKGQTKNKERRALAEPLNRRKLLKGDFNSFFCMEMRRAGRGKGMGKG